MKLTLAKFGMGVEVVLTKSLKLLMLQLTQVSHSFSSHCFKLNVFILKNIPTQCTFTTKLRNKADILDFLFSREKNKRKKYSTSQIISIAMKQEKSYNPFPSPSYVGDSDASSMLYCHLVGLTLQFLWFLSVWVVCNTYLLWGNFSLFCDLFIFRFWVLERTSAKLASCRQPSLKKSIYLSRLLRLPWFKLLCSLVFCCWSTGGFELMRGFMIS